jgi:hypothetical protein
MLLSIQSYTEPYPALPILCTTTWSLSQAWPAISVTCLVPESQYVLLVSQALLHIVSSQPRLMAQITTWALPTSYSDYAFLSWPELLELARASQSHPEHSELTGPSLELLNCLEASQDHHKVYNPPLETSIVFESSWRPLWTSWSL